MDIFKQMEKRVNVSKPPVMSTDISKYNEKLTQWYLEHVFFRDFVYKNPLNKKGQEFSDVLIIYDDTIIIIQNKSQLSKKNSLKWAEKNLNSALKQLNGSYRNIINGITTSFYNDTLGIEIDINLKKHKYIYGLVVLAQDCERYNPYDIIDQSNLPDFNFTIMSLNDLLFVIERMDTAADLIVYLEYRFDCIKNNFLPLINDEESNLKSISEFVPKILAPQLELINEDQGKKTIEKSQFQLIYGLKKSKDYIYSLLFDDIIARAHEVDTDIFGTEKKELETAHKVAEVLGYVNRYRRIAIGKKLHTAAFNSSRDGKDKIIIHIQKPVKQVYIFLISDMVRSERMKFLNAYAIIVQKK